MPEAYREQWYHVIMQIASSSYASLTPVQGYIIKIETLLQNTPWLLDILN